MNPKTEQCMNDMVEFAREGNDIIPMFFQSHGCATVSAAVRAAKRRGLIVQNGVDGAGQPKYAAVMPEPTHQSTAVIQ